MNDKVIVVDLVRHYGDARFRIETVRQYINAHYSGAKTAWFIRAEQATLLDKEDLVFQHSASRDGDHAPKIRDWISQRANNGAAGCRFFVLSYDSSVLGITTRLNTDSLVVVPMHFSSLEGDRGPRQILPRPASPLFGFDASRPFSEQYVDELAIESLRRNGCTSESTSLPQAKLRIEMAKIDPRAEKNTSDPASLNLIKGVVYRGSRAGWLGQKRPVASGSERVWLKEVPGASIERPVPATSSLTVTVATSGEAVTPAPPTEAAGERKAREDQMEDVLRADRIGSASIPRQCLFDSIEKILLNKDANHTASHLMARAREMAIGLAKDRGYVKEQNWQAIADCVLNMLLEAGVLLNAEGKSIPRRIGVYSTQVASVSKDFRQRSEAILVERIIQKLPDVTYHDCYSIGLALYQQGKTNPVSREDLLSRVDALLVYLDTDHRIHAEGIRLVPGPHPSA